MEGAGEAAGDGPSSGPPGRPGRDRASTSGWASRRRRRVGGLAVAPGAILGDEQADRGGGAGGAHGLVLVGTGGRRACPDNRAEGPRRPSGNALKTAGRLPQNRCRDDAMIGACRTPIRPTAGRATPSPRARSTRAPSPTRPPAPSRRRSTRRRPIAQDGVGRPRNGYEYARSQNPTRERLERAVADLEGGRHGIAFASGSATTAAIAQLAGAGDEILVGDDVYGGTYRYLERVHRPAGGGSATLRRPRDRATDALWEGLTDRTRLVWFESPSNPLLKVTDIAASAATIRDRAAQAGQARAARRRRQHLRVARPPAAARARRRHRVPLGHQVPRRALGRDPRHRGHLERRRRRAAAVPPERDGRRARAVRLLPDPARPPDPRPADGAPLRQRDGRRPVPRRPRRRGVGRLSGPRPTVATRIPGTRPPRARCASATTPAFGGMVSFTLAAGGAAGPQRRPSGRVAVCESVRLFTLGESLGSVESLIEVPAAMTHLSVVGVGARGRPGARAAVGRDRGRRATWSRTWRQALDRDAGDLIEDLRLALDRA